MKRTHFTFAFALATLLAANTAPALSSEVGVSISIGQPAFYGRVDVGALPPPPVIYRQAMIVERRPFAGEPLYLHVPPGHARHWNKQCHNYQACGRPVYFVRHDRYQRAYEPRHWHGAKRHVRHDGRHNTYRQRSRDSHGHGR